MSWLGRERHPFVGLAMAAIAGIIAADWLPASNIASIALTLCAAIVCLRWHPASLVYSVVAAAFFCLHSSRITSTAADELARFVGGGIRPASVRGVVTTEPKIEPNGVATFSLKLKKVRCDTNKLRTTATVYVHWRGQAQIGDELALFGTLQPIDPPRNPGEFDMRSFLARRGVTRALMVRAPENAHLVQRRGGFCVLRAAAISRDWMQRTLSRGIEDSPEVVGLICGTSLGLRHQTRDDIEEPFQQTGTLHLFAVAGLHVGIVAWLLWTVAAIARVPKKLATALIIPLLFFYAAVTGLHTASIRAALMSAILIAGVFFDRKVFALNSLAAAAFLILLWDSNELFTSGFQLSFCVVAAIVIFARPMYRWFRRFGQPDPFIPRALFSPWRKLQLRTSDAIARGGSVSLAASLGSLPCIYWYFHLITPVSLFANLAVVPIAYFVLALALLSLMAAPFSSALSIIFNNANWLLSHAVLALVHLFAALPFGHFYLRDLSTPSAAIAITVLDEGTGGAAHVRANGYQWLIDCGNARSYERTLKAYLHYCGVNRLQGLLLTHGDAQHIGAASDVIDDFSPREIYDNPLTVRSSVQRHLAGRSRRRSVSRGDALVFGHDVHARILYPPANLTVTAADDAPLIVQLTINDQTSVLFESDAGDEAEAALLGAGEELQSDILVKGQHHDGGSGTPEFLDAVRPALIIASSRPSPFAENVSGEWASDVAERGIKLIRQDQSGAVEIQFRGGGWQARSYSTGEILRKTKR
ncbi:MAG: ComEC/Rec2 family competence protein [Chthoniobacterales bacterium]